MKGIGRILREKKGASLVMVIALMALVAIFCTLLLVFSTSAQKASYTVREESQAYFIAKSVCQSICAALSDADTIAYDKDKSAADQNPWYRLLLQMDDSAAPVPAAELDGGVFWVTDTQYGTYTAKIELTDRGPADTQTQPPVTDTSGDTLDKVTKEERSFEDRGYRVTVAAEYAGERYTLCADIDQAQKVTTTVTEEFFTKPGTAGGGGGAGSGIFVTVAGDVVMQGGQGAAAGTEIAYEGNVYFKRTNGRHVIYDSVTVGGSLFAEGTLVFQTTGPWELAPGFDNLADLWVTTGFTGLDYPLLVRHGSIFSTEQGVTLPGGSQVGSAELKGNNPFATDVPNGSVFVNMGPVNLLSAAEEAPTIVYGNVTSLTGQVTIGDHCRVGGLASAPNSNLTVGADCQVGGGVQGCGVVIGKNTVVQGDIIAHGNVSLGAGCVVNGNIYAAGIIQREEGATVNGTENPGSVQPFQTFQTAVFPEIKQTVNEKTLGPCASAPVADLGHIDAGGVIDAAAVGKKAQVLEFFTQEGQTLHVDVCGEGQTLRIDDIKIHGKGNVILHLLDSVSLEFSNNAGTVGEVYLDDGQEQPQEGRVALYIFARAAFWNQKITIGNATTLKAHIHLAPNDRGSNGRYPEVIFEHDASLVGSVEAITVSYHTASNAQPNAVVQVQPELDLVDTAFVHYPGIDSVGGIGGGGTVEVPGVPVPDKNTTTVTATYTVGKVKYYKAA